MNLRIYWLFIFLRERCGAFYYKGNTKDGLPKWLLRSSKNKKYRYVLLGVVIYDYFGAIF